MKQRERVKVQKADIERHLADRHQLSDYEVSQWSKNGVVMVIGDRAFDFDYIDIRKAICRMLGVLHCDSIDFGVGPREYVTVSVVWDWPNKLWVWSPFGSKPFINEERLFLPKSAPANRA